MEAGEAMGPYKGTQWPMQEDSLPLNRIPELSYTAQAWTRGKKKQPPLIRLPDISFDEGKATLP